MPTSLTVAAVAASALFASTIATDSACGQAAAAAAGPRCLATCVWANTRRGVVAEGAPPQSVVGLDARWIAARDQHLLVPLEFRLTQALDERERELISPDRLHRGDPREERQAVEQGFRTALFNSTAPHPGVQGSVGVDRPLPSRLSIVRASARAVAARAAVSIPVGPKPMESPVEIVPGVTLLVTSFVVGPTLAEVAYEVRVKRVRAGGDVLPGLEPVFAGIALRDASRSTLQVIMPDQSLDTRDEYHRVAQRTSFTRELFDRTASFEAVVYDGLRLHEVQVEVRDVVLAE
jgi:hypothetical protein